MKKFVKYFLKDLKLKKRIRGKENEAPLPVILEGKTPLAKELVFYHEIKRKLR